MNDRRCLAAAISVLVMLAIRPAAAQFGPDSSVAADTLDRVVAVVEDDVVTRRELDQALAVVSRQVGRRGGQAPPARVLERQVLERLILQQLQLRAAEQRGVVVDDPSLNAAVESIAKRNKMSLSQLRVAVERDGTSYAAYRESIRKELLGNRLRQIEVENRVQITEQEVENALGGNGAGREYRVAQILIAVPEGASAADIETARARAEQLLAELEAGADFADRAASVSDSREALEGGDLGWRSASQLPSIFANAVPRLQPGEVTQPIRSTAGFHLVKLVQTRAAENAGVDSREVEEQLFRRKAEEEWEQWLRRLRDEAYVEIRL